MNLLTRYRRLSFWNRVGAWGSIASIISIPLAIKLVLIPLLFFSDGTKTPHGNSQEKGVMGQSRPQPSSQNPVKRTAPIVTFRDGQKASIGISITTHVEEHDVLLIVTKSGSREAATASLESKVVSSAISQLETKTLPQARQERKEIELNLHKELYPLFKNAGLTLDYISLLEFQEVK